jgi:acyl dehydratase
MGGPYRFPRHCDRPDGRIMTETIVPSCLKVGTRLPDREFVLTRVDLLKYCGACTDMTPTHWNERIARSVDLPNVIAHGTLLVATAVRAVTDWFGDPGALLEYRARFSRSVAVPDDDVGTTLQVAGVIDGILEGGRTVVRLTVSSDGVEVLSGVRAVVNTGGGDARESVGGSVACEIR